MNKYVIAVGATLLYIPIFYIAITEFPVLSSTLLAIEVVDSSILNPETRS